MLGGDEVLNLPDDVFRHPAAPDRLEETVFLRGQRGSSDCWSDQ